MEKRLVAVAYDVADARRRVRLGRWLGGFGVRIGMSTFECLVPPERLSALPQELADRLDLAVDRVKVYPLCSACRCGVCGLGMPLGALPQGGWFI